jgi:FMN reductase
MTIPHAPLPSAHVPAGHGHHGLRLLGISGSLRAKSLSARALAVALATAAKHGAEVRTIDLRTAGLPVFDPDHREGHSAQDAEAIKNVAGQVRWAEAYILAFPDYHGSMPGGLKNMLDFHWHDLAGKLFGYICSSHEKGLTAMDQARTAVRQCYGWSMPYGVAVMDDNDLAPGAKALGRLAMVGRDAAVYGRVLRDQYMADLSGTEVDTFVAKSRGR